MSNAVRKSNLKSRAALGTTEQNELFVDKTNINLTKSQVDAQTLANHD